MDSTRPVFNRPTERDLTDRMAGRVATADSKPMGPRSLAMATGERPVQAGAVGIAPFRVTRAEAIREYLSLGRVPEAALLATLAGVVLAAGLVMQVQAMQWVALGMRVPVIQGPIRAMRLRANREVALLMAVLAMVVVRALRVLVAVPSPLPLQPASPAASAPQAAGSPVIHHSRRACPDSGESALQTLLEWRAAARAKPSPRPCPVVRPARVA